MLSDRPFFLPLHPLHPPRAYCSPLFVIETCVSRHEPPRSITRQRLFIHDSMRSTPPGYCFFSPLVTERQPLFEKRAFLCRSTKANVSSFLSSLCKRLKSGSIYLLLREINYFLLARISRLLDFDRNNF